MSHQASFLLAQPDDYMSTSDGKAGLWFEEFWHMWPRREAKVAAMKAWKRLNNRDRLEAMDGVKKFLGRERRFIPHPATYLNGRRWEDEVVQPAPQVGQGPSPELPFGCRACRKRFLSAAERDAHDCGGQT